MQIYSYKFDRIIWLTTTPTEIRPDLQDLPGNFEYERTASVSNVKAVCKALKVSYNEAEAKLLLLLKNQKIAFDLFTEFLDDHKIHFHYFSESR